MKIFTLCSFSQTAWIFSQCRTMSNVNFFTTDKFCQFQEIVNFFTNSTFLSKNCACEVFHKSAGASARRKMSSVFCKKNFYFFYLTKCEKPSGKFSLGLAHIVELCRQFLPLLFGVVLSSFGSYRQELLTWIFPFLILAQSHSLLFYSYIAHSSKFFKFGSLEPYRGLLIWGLHYSANPNSVAFLSFVFTTWSVSTNCFSKADIFWFVKSFNSISSAWICAIVIGVLFSVRTSMM